MSFSVTVGQVYDGPMDLLLDLIRRQNIDIYDIPMGLITAQFLEYCRRDRSDVDGSGEFVYTASLLIHIKSKMLLPLDPSAPGAATAEIEDPRSELVQMLLDYKSAARMLMDRNQLAEASWTVAGARELFPEDDAAGDREREVASVDLVEVFQNILDRLKGRAVHHVADEGTTVAEMIVYVKRRLSFADRPLSLEVLLDGTRSRSGAICIFLALLELARLQTILIYQAEPCGGILVKKSPQFDELLDSQAALRDDWR